MSQEYKTATKRSHRTRTPRHRPVLVTESALTGNAETAVAEEQVIANPTTGQLSLDTPPPPTTEHLITTALFKRPSRLPNFFKKTEQATSVTAQDVVDARMARAKKSTSEKTDTVEASSTEAKVETKAPSKAQPAKRPGMFKPRHIIGLIIYMLVANFVLTFERSYVIGAHLERNLFTIPGFNLPISTSILLNIVTLIVVLYAMVTFDLLPNGKQYAQQTAQGKNGRGGTSQGNTVKKVQPTVRQGVQGQDDDLYQAYRQGQRNKKH